MVNKDLTSLSSPAEQFDVTPAPQVGDRPVSVPWTAKKVSCTMTVEKVATQPAKIPAQKTAKKLVLRVATAPMVSYRRLISGRFNFLYRSI